eukprot:scaffold248783_cov17-Tisochrysis_lutea.AAC.1
MGKDHSKFKQASMRAGWVRVRMGREWLDKVVWHQMNARVLNPQMRWCLALMKTAERFPEQDPQTIMMLYCGATLKSSLWNQGILAPMTNRSATGSELLCKSCKIAHECQLSPDGSITNCDSHAPAL